LPTCVPLLPPSPPLHPTSSSTTTSPTSRFTLADVRRVIVAPPVGRLSSDSYGTRIDVPPWNATIYIYTGSMACGERKIVSKTEERWKICGRFVEAPPQHAGERQGSVVAGVVSGAR